MKRLLSLAAIAAIVWMASAAMAAETTEEAGAAKAEATSAAPAEATPAAEAPRSADGRLQQHCLESVPADGRFVIPPDRVWPAKAGEADICLWADDKMAAASITIDDNWAPDHAWWTELNKKTGFRFTWFVISGRVGSGLWGTWDGFQKLLDAGFDVQSHTVTHLHVDEEGYKGVDWDYGESVKQIETGLPGHTPICLAYPGGKQSSQNDPKLAAKYFIAGRGTTGAPNPVNRINYMRTNSASISKEMIDKILDKEQLKRGKYGYYRAWLCSHYHGVNYGKTDEEKKAHAEKIAENMMYLKSKEADVWVGLFREVVQYGQERDTAKLKVTGSAADKITLTLSDDMDDKLFDYPLTVKVRLPDGWSKVSATQGGKAIDAAVVEHEGGKYALVKAVPDRGEVVLTAGAAN